MKPHAWWKPVVLAIPAGVIGGALAAALLGGMLMHLRGEGHSHDATMVVCFDGLSGAVIGALILPALIWYLGKLRRQREEYQFE